MSVVVVNNHPSATEISNLSDKHIQQAAVDLSIERVWAVERDVFLIDEEQKRFRSTTELFVGEDGYWNLPEGVYEISTQHSVTMSDNEVGLVVTRSSLLRNGVTISSGLMDPAFKTNNIGAVMHVRGGAMKIKPGTRVAQFIVWQVANPQGKYDGDFGLNADGTPKAMEAKYTN